mmetsp:Transcript_98522/g.190275  ORF Transcript_98522/g.190275 Transcript_98522/m.190275 type:complete len:87 (+) Transcript_98522:686-946(+)
MRKRNYFFMCRNLAAELLVLRHVPGKAKTPSIHHRPGSEVLGRYILSMGTTARQGIAPEPVAAKPPANTNTAEMLGSRGNKVAKWS